NPRPRPTTRARQLDRMMTPTRASGRVDGVVRGRHAQLARARLAARLPGDGVGVHSADQPAGEAARSGQAPEAITEPLRSAKILTTILPKPWEKSGNHDRRYGERACQVTGKYMAGYLGDAQWHLPKLRRFESGRPLHNSDGVTGHCLVTPVSFYVAF